MTSERAFTGAPGRACPFADCRRGLRADNRKGVCGRCAARGRTLSAVVRVNAGPRACGYADCRRRLRADNRSGICSECWQERGRRGAGPGWEPGARGAVFDGRSLELEVSPRQPRVVEVARSAANSPPHPLARVVSAAQRVATHREDEDHRVGGCLGCPVFDSLMDRCRHPESLVLSQHFGVDVEHPSDAAPVWCPLVLLGPLRLVAKSRSAA